MEHFLSTTTGVITLSAWVAISVLSIVAQVIQWFKGNEHEVVHECSEAINILKNDLNLLRESSTEQIKGLQSEVLALRKDKHDTNNKLQEQILETEKLKSFIAGTDPASVEYRKQGLEVFAIAKEAYRVITQVDQRSLKIEEISQKTQENIERLCMAIEQHLKVLEIKA